ncbi:WD domain, G-beta repeat-containing protein [Cardiosporidium cionae]|uniref:WD domain, G-beta repeat-containing protein n=1 Tax=Cardiosporidium cionae TaxID=476202 RepID=A0ABQ7JG37_9APIC|nr:WD domain, G-beta repeat-containing protein [Cardiosporidium cionae]|eukprot:KAF8822982.1 WD domain, G-beta repeat-containing protein [Cardiosporidium cionae]
METTVTESDVKPQESVSAASASKEEAAGTSSDANVVSTNASESTSSGDEKVAAPASTVELEAAVVEAAESDAPAIDTTLNDSSSPNESPDVAQNEETSSNGSSSGKSSEGQSPSNSANDRSNKSDPQEPVDEISNTLSTFVASEQDLKQEFVFLKSYSFNQNASGFICTTTKGIRVYTCEPLFEFTKHEYPNWDIGPCVVGQMLYKTNCFIVVSADEKKKVKIWNDQSKKVVGELRSRVDVIQVCIARYILAMITEYAIYVYKCEYMSPLQVIQTGRNPCGLCSIANVDTSVEWKIACPANVAGAVRILTSEGGRSNHVFTAHKAPLFNLAFNYDGSMIASASSKGTVVRVFSVFEGNLLYEFRRGTPSSMISCITFRRDDMFLATASSTSTVHIFKLCSSRRNAYYDFPQLFGENYVRPNSTSDRNNEMPPYPTTSSNNDADGSDGIATAEGVARRNTPSEEIFRGKLECPTPAPNESSSSSGIASAIYDTSVGVVQDTLKGVLPNYFKPDRSFAQFHIPRDNLTIDVTDNSSNIIGPLCAFVHVDSTHLYLLHLNGIFYEFRFDPIKGGDCETMVATTWFSPRADFHIQSHHGCETVPSAIEGGHEGDEWQVL